MRTTEYRGYRIEAEWRGRWWRVRIVAIPKRPSFYTESPRDPYVLPFQRDGWDDVEQAIELAKARIDIDTDNPPRLRPMSRVGGDPDTMFLRCLASQGKKPGDMTAYTLKQQRDAGLIGGAS